MHTWIYAYMCTFVLIYQFFLFLNLILKIKAQILNTSSNILIINFTRCFNENVNVSNYISRFTNLKDDTYKTF